MPVPHISDSFGDVLDIRFQRIFHEVFPQLPDMLPQLFNFEGTNGRNDMRFSAVGALGDFQEFAGTVQYDSLNQGFDTIITPLEFVSGIQTERKLFDDDQYQILDQRPRALATAANRTRQKHGARIFNLGFSVDTFLYNNTEGVALFSNSHTTTAPGVSTATGFDNLVTASLTWTAVKAARIQARSFRDDRGNRIDVNMNELLYPPDLYGEAFEIVQSAGRPDTATNARNVHEGQYLLREWNYLTDTNNWFLMDSMQRPLMLHWTDRIGIEFAMVEDFDKIIAKWRGYQRYANGWSDWRFGIGSLVA